MQVQIPAGHLPVFFSFIVFLPFGFLLFILTADPVRFARFLRKRISSHIICKIIETMIETSIPNRNEPQLPANG